MSQNAITDGAGEKIANILGRNNVLTDINLSNNLLKDDTGFKFVNILVRNFTLQTVNLDLNSINQHTKDEIYEKLVHNRELAKNQEHSPKKFQTLKKSLEGKDINKKIEQTMESIF